jgi:uncharacterized protein DUF4326
MVPQLRMQPRRLCLSRRAGSRLPPGARSVASPTRWANPFRPTQRSQQANREAVDAFRSWLVHQPELIAAARRELTGADLACWCSPELPCHADVWLEILGAEAVGEC